MFKKKRNIGKLLLGSFLIVAVLTACMEEKREMKIDMLSRPGTIDRNVSYQGNRLPLKPLHFIKLPVGTIEPEGWLKKYLLLQKEGLTGKLGEISAWLDKKDNACIIRKSKFPQNPKRSVRFSGKGTKRSVQKRKARNTQKAETKVL